MNDCFKGIRSWALSKDQRFLIEDINKCKGEEVFAPMRKGSSCWTNMLRLLYEIKIRSSSVLQIWLGSLRELHYLSDLVRLLASRCIEQDDAICCGGWCSEFRCAVGKRRRGQEDECVTWAGLSQLWKLVTWRKSFFPPDCVLHHRGHWSSGRLKEKQVWKLPSLPTPPLITKTQENFGWIRSPTESRKGQFWKVREDWVGRWRINRTLHQL